MLGDINTQHGHKTARLVDHGGALIVRIFAHDAITVPTVVGGAVGVAHGFADASSQAVVAVGGFAGSPQFAGVVGDARRHSPGLNVRRWAVGVRSGYRPRRSGSGYRLAVPGYYQKGPVGLLTDYRPRHTVAVGVVTMLAAD